MRLRRVWILEQMTSVGSDDYQRLGVYANLREVLEDHILTNLARSWAANGELRAGVDEGRGVLWLEKYTDRIELVPELFRPIRTESSSPVDPIDLPALRSLLSKLMKAISDPDPDTSPFRTGDGRPVAGSWKFVPEPDPEF